MLSLRLPDGFKTGSEIDQQSVCDTTRFKVLIFLLSDFVVNCFVMAKCPALGT